MQAEQADNSFDRAGVTAEPVTRRATVPRPTPGCQSSPGGIEEELRRAHAGADEGRARDATDELVRLHGPQLFACALAAAGGNRHVAEDGYQDGLREVWERRRTYDPSRAWAPWARHWVRFRTADRLRREYRHLRGGPPAADAPPRAGPRRVAEVDFSTLAERKPDPAEAAADADAVAHCLARLAAELPDLHAVFHLRHVEDLRMEEVAGRLGLPPGTAYNRCARARQLLAECVERQFGGRT